MEVEERQMGPLPRTMLVSADAGVAVVGGNNSSNSNSID